MTKTSYISAGIAAAVLATSVFSGSAMAGDNPGGCMHLQGGFMWNICDHERNTPKGRRTRAEPQNPAANVPVTRDRGIWGTILPESIVIERNPGFPGDGVGGNGDGNGGEGGGNGGARG